MKHIIKSVVFAIGISAAWKAHAQQNIQFTQYIFNSMSVNPAYTGYKEEWFGQLGLRSQWVGLEGAPQTGLLSIDGVADPINKRHGVGMQITADRLGPQSATSAYANYAFRLRLNEEDTQRLSFGVAAGVTQYSLDGSLLDPVEGGDQVLPAGKISNWVPDVRFGVYYYNPKWYAGVSVMDLLSGDQSNNIFRWDNTTTDNIRRKRHLYFIGGALFDLSKGLKLRPSLLVKEDFNGPTSLDLNAMFIFGDRFWLGAGWRTGVTVFEREYNRVSGNSLNGRNSFSAITQIYVTDVLRIGYSYDHIVSRLSNVQNGSHEITLGITFGPKAQRVLSPRFF
ncbi:PorP/SprF family type IX secretion system membrane protein [Parapedobacter indicus]|uniref:Type IX secretion system membrane protein, PorP/SprF family n=1 Tax=Parapedobacter indicus TaxID=1477437 RepID=A0A1I3R153_9SPHI|nr:type IX secretion system membrane protein PorP/SprF [Parapedobacter indicus]PPL00294.1 type IX secretion system PorP/SprF family membrane protein [Parapedobacter indicus]SFJ39087.1 type IX secretion system membrane protein, PorP/SprF family [Parapedobacter indicus]